MTSKTTRKLKRYHRDICFPDWYDEAMNDFLKTAVVKRSRVFSFHALEKIIDYCFEYGRVLMKFVDKSIKNNSMTKEQVFEFYHRNGEIKKACFRVSPKEFPMDIILVLSRDGTVITLYLTNKGDDHATLNRKLYEQK